MDEDAVSKIVFRDIGVISQHQSGLTSELRTQDDADTNTGNADEPRAWDIENYTRRDAVLKGQVLGFQASTVSA